MKLQFQIRTNQLNIDVVVQSIDLITNSIMSELQEPFQDTIDETKTELITKLRLLEFKYIDEISRIGK